MYSTLTQDFADRAEQLISTKSPANMLYAALEIRMGVEARLQSYVQASAEVSNKLKNGWQIPKLFKGLENTLSNSSQVVEFVVSAAGTPPVTMYFIPVSRRLRTHAEKFGNVLHVTKDSHGGDAWWQSLERSLLDALRDLSICAKATLLGVPLLEPNTGHVLTNFEFPQGDERYELMRKLAASKEPHQFKVSYLATEGYYESAR